MAIIINPELVHIPLAQTDVHHDALRNELAAIGPHVTGVSTMNGRVHHANVQTTVTPKLDIAITMALEGYETRLSAEYIRANALDEMRAVYSDEIVNILKSGKAEQVLTDNYRMRQGLAPMDLASPTLDDDGYKRLVDAYSVDLPRRIHEFEPRLRLLTELQLKFPQVTDISFMRGDVYVSVTGDIPDGTHEAIADVAAKHDPTPPKSEPTGDERIAAMEAKIAQLLAAKQ